MEDTARGQVTRSAADVYEAFFVPALFHDWTGRVSEAAGLKPGDRVLDVACGTGVLAREAWSRIQPGGSLTGVDINDGMLAVARRKSPEIDWQEGQAESLPFGEASFDAVVSQFGLMFFEDRVAALGEMWRVLRPGGRLAVAVWDSLDNTPGYAAVTALLQRLFGDRVADGMRAPYNLGDPEVLLPLFGATGIPDASLSTMDGSARFPSIESWVHTDVKGWTLADLIDDAQYETLQQAAQSELAPFAQADGTVKFGAPAHIVTAAKP
jgi:ubiquinone/menaquinone biosynthesis C-methylase UbiE